MKLVSLNNITQNNTLRYLKLFNIEALVWLAGLISFAFLNPYNTSNFTLFLPDLLFGIKSPGYNLGHSIAFLYRGQVIESFNTHPLGIFVFLFLIYRIVYLIRNNYKKLIKEGVHND